MALARTSPVAPTRLTPGAADAVSDADLVTQALEGSAWAEAALCRRYVHAVSGTLTRLLGQKSDADDVAQDAFVVALETLPRLRDPAAFKGWLFRIATNLAKKRLRRRRLENILGVAPSRHDTDPEVFGCAPVDPNARAELVLLESRLERLSANLRVAWCLRYVEGWELTEVAELCGCSLATVKRRLARANDKLDARVELRERR